MDIKKFFAGLALLTALGCDPEGISRYYIVNQLEREATISVYKPDESQIYELASQEAVLIKTAQGLSGEDFNVFDIDSLKAVHSTDTLRWTIDSSALGTEKNFYDAQDWQQEAIDDHEITYRFVLKRE